MEDFASMTHVYVGAGSGIFSSSPCSTSLYYSHDIFFSFHTISERVSKGKDASFQIERDAATVEEQLFLFNPYQKTRMQEMLILFLRESKRISSTSH